MTTKDLRKLNRRQLLELMLKQSKRIDELEQQLMDARNALENQRIIKERAGSIADAALEINKVFEAAQNAANQYLYSVRKSAMELSINEKK